MIRRTSLIVLEAVAGTIGIAVIGVCALFWTLSQGPIRLDFARPYIEQALGNAGLGRSITVDETALVWPGFGEAVELRANGVAAFGGDRASLWSVEALSVDLSALSLLRGRVAPRAITLIGPHVSALRHSDGRLSFDITTAQAQEEQDQKPAQAGGVSPQRPAPGDDKTMATLLNALARDPGAPGEFHALREIRIRRAAVDIDDRILGTQLVAPRADLTLTRSESGVVADAKIDLRLGGQTSTFRAAATMPPGAPTLSATLVFDDVRPVVLADLHPALKDLARLRLPVSGSVSLRVDRRLAVSDIRADLSTGSGTLLLPELYNAPVTVAMMQFSADYDARRKRLSVEDFFFDLGGFGASLNGSAAWNGNEIEATVAFESKPLRLDDLDTYWPPKIPQGGRKWVTNRLSDGVIERASGSADLTAPLAEPTAITVTRAGGQMRIAGASVEYMLGMPKARDVTGTVGFDAEGMDIRISEGRLLDARLVGGEAAITGLMSPDQWIDIDVDLAGPFATAMRVLDRPRLGYATALGLPPDRVGGDARINLRFSFPLIKKLALDMVEIEAVASLDRAQAADLVLGRDLENGDLRVRVDRRGMEVSGTALFAGIDSRFRWRQQFDNSAEPSAEIWASAAVDNADRARFGLTLPPSVVTGPSAVELYYASRAGGRAEVNINADLTDTALDLWQLDYRKEPGKIAFAQAAVELRDGAIDAVRDLRLWDDRIFVSGTFETANDARRIALVEVDSLIHGSTDARVTIDLRNPDETKVSVRGASLDLGAAIEGMPDADADFASGGGIDLLAVRPSDMPAAQAFTLDVDVDRAVGAFDETLTGFTGRAVYDGRRLASVSLEADAAAGPISFAFEPAEGGQRLTIAAADAGAAARFLNFTDSIKGGTVTIDGETESHQNEAALSGHFAISDFMAVDTPVLVRLINATTPAGLVDLLGRRGISFTGFSGNFLWQGDRLKLANGQAVGSSIGLSLEGVADLSDNFVDMEGTVVPVYGVNRVISKIPLIGDIVTGGEGEGLFGANYQVVGRFDQPDIRVNPLSALAPGMFRRLFFSGSSPDDRAAARDAQSGQAPVDPEKVLNAPETPPVYDN